MVMIKTWRSVKSQHTISLKKSVLESIIILYMLKNAVDNFLHWRLCASSLFNIEIPYTETAINAFRTMLNNYIYLANLFKLNTMQHVFLIYNSERLFNLEKSNVNAIKEAR